MKISILSIFACCMLLTISNTNAQKKSKKIHKEYIDRANMDFSIKPGDNFYLYANGNWIKNNPVPASKTRWGSFDVLRLESSERLRQLAEAAAANPSKDSIYQRVGDFYASGMDTLAIDKLGYDPIRPELQKLEAITDKQQALNEIASIRTIGYGVPLFRFGVGQDEKNVNQYIPQLSQGGTTLPDRDYYLKRHYHPEVKKSK